MPELAVDQVGDILDRLVSRPLVTTPGLCARQRHRRSTCTRCTDVCPTGAIHWSEGLQIDWEACTGCGICATVCPSAALEARAPTQEEVLVQIQRVTRDQDWVALACQRAQEGLGGRAPCLTVSCLGRLDESLLVSAVADGAKSIWLVDGACESCPQAVGRAVAGAAAARSNALLEAFGLPAAVVLRHDFPAVQPVDGDVLGSQLDVSRRGLFKALARETARVGEITAETARKSEGRQEAPARTRGELPRALPARRLLLLAALKRLGSPVVSTFADDKDGLFGHVSLGDACTACQMCGFFCPTGALSKVEEDGRAALAFRVSACTNCGLCRDICYRDAVLLTPQVDLNAVLALSVEWLVVQDRSTAPWEDPPDQRIGRKILEALGI